MSRATVAALVLAALGVALYALVVEPERVRAAAVVEALEQARRDHRAARAELAAAQTRARRPVSASANPVEVRARVLRVLEALPVHGVRLAVRPTVEGVTVQVDARARQAVALGLADRLVTGAGVQLRDVSLKQVDGGVVVAITAVAP